jgi:cell division protein ZapA
MSNQFSVSVNGRSFPVSCNPGEEDRIKALATYVDEKARDLTMKMAGRVNDLHLMVLVALVLTDELTEALDANDRISAQTTIDPRLADPAFVKALELLAGRMENIARTLEG